MKHNYFQLFSILAWTDFKLRYHGSILGFLWALLKPILIFLILNFVFSNIFGRGDPYFSVRLLLGIVLWNFFAEGTMMGMISLHSKAAIITKVKFPLWIVVVASIANIMLTFLINLGIFSVFLIIAKGIPSLTQVAVFLYYVVLITMVIMSFSFITSTLFIKLRDLNQVWEVLLIAGFYACPIIYPISVIPRNVQWVIFLNPMTFVIQYSKLVLIEGKFQNLTLHIIYTLIVVAVFLFGIWVFSRNAKKVPEHL